MMKLYVQQYDPPQWVQYGAPVADLAAAMSEARAALRTMGLLFAAPGSRLIWQCAIVPSMQTKRTLVTLPEDAIRFDVTEETAPTPESPDSPESETPSPKPTTVGLSLAGLSLEGSIALVDALHGIEITEDNEAENIAKLLDTVVPLTKRADLPDEDKIILLKLCQSDDHLLHFVRHRWSAHRVTGIAAKMIDQLNEANDCGIVLTALAIVMLAELERFDRSLEQYIVSLQRLKAGQDAERQKRQESGN